MSFSALNIGASALYAAQRASELAAHNVANASTPGFTKQRLSVSTALPSPGTPGLRGDGMRGNGVTIMSIDRMRDLLADLSYRNDAATAGASSARADVLSRAEGVLGVYPGGTSEALDRFFSSWDQLSRTPEAPAARANVLDAGRQLAGSLSSAVAQLGQLSEDIGQRIRSSVEEVNGLARTIAGLNQGIAEAVTGGQSPNDLLDQRDVALDRLSALTGSSVQKGSISQVDVYIGNSLLVTANESVELRAVRSGGTWGVTFPDGAGVTAGELGAYSRAISVDLPDFVRQIDDVAAQLAARVNAVHRGAHSLDSHGPDPDAATSSSATPPARCRSGPTSPSPASPCRPRAQPATATPRSTCRRCATARPLSATSCAASTAGSAPPSPTPSATARRRPPPCPAPTPAARRPTA